MTWIIWRPLFAVWEDAGQGPGPHQHGACHRRAGAKGWAVASSLDLSALRAAVAALEGSLRVTGDSTWFDAQSQVVRDTLIAGVVQNFEFVYDLSVKMLRRQLERGSDSPDEVDRAAFRDMLRTAGEKGLIENVAAWFLHRTMRNISAHTYDHEKARTVYQAAPALLNDARDLLVAPEPSNG